MTKEEKIRIYSAYMPYGLLICTSYNNGKSWNKPKKMLGADLDRLRTLVKYKPVIYDLSYLTKEIEHEGETFVPMIKLLELQETNHFSKNKVIKDATVFDQSKVIDYFTKTWNLHAEWTEYKVRYLVETSNMGTLVYSLTYEEGFDRFVARDETRKVNLGVGHQRQMFDKLLEWHLNIFNLPEGEFINKATLK